MEEFKENDNDYKEINIYFKNKDVDYTVNSNDIYRIQ